MLDTTNSTVTQILNQTQVSQYYNKLLILV